MKFSTAPEQRDFAASLRELLASSDVVSVARAWAAGDVAPGRKLWSRLGEMGVLSLGAAESGATPVDLVLGFEELGRAAVPGPLVESVAVLPVLGIDPGDALATLALPPHVPFAVDAAVADAVYLVEGGTLFTATVSATATSVDPARRLAEVVPADEVGPVDPTAAFELGALATAAQIHGAGAALLHRSTEYAMQRKQFGRPIGSFQAVKHLLADAYVALEVARPLLYGAALAIGSPTETRDVSAAKVACTDAAYRASRAALQVHGAIGYTAEYDLALWLTKVRALVSAWGTQRMHRDRVLGAIRG
jgi:alkylation response protein AidB-like acyl-CoA dehydrogenase